MNLEIAYQDFLQTHQAELNAEHSNQSILSLIDLTLLDESATKLSIQDLEKTAKSNQVAAVCVLLKHLPYFSSSTLNKATVINFPSGREPQRQSISDLQKAFEYDINEIDFVFPYSAYLSGEKHGALGHLKACFELCQSTKVKLKVILETGALPSIDVIYQMSCDILSIGCDFLKTSTGKIATGATLPAAWAMLSAIKNNQASSGIKISGGIRTKDQALTYINLAQIFTGQEVNNSWFRIGASQLVNELSTAPGLY